VPRLSLPIPPPLEGNDELITGVITGGWAVAFIVLLLVRGQLAPADRWWTWVAVAGCCIGVLGLGYMPFLKRSRLRAATRRNANASD
jgi:Protein of unknown function (DUF2530)